MSFDHGYSAPFAAHWWATDTDGRLYCYRELYGSDGVPNHGLFMSPKQIAKSIWECEEQERMDNIRVQRVADPAIFDRSRGDSVADMMRDFDGRGNGILFNPGDNNRMAGKMQVHERLRMDGTNRPMVYFFDTCKNMIRTLPALPYDQHKIEDIDTKAEDHCYDSLRYMAMFRAIAAPGLKVRKPKTYDPYEEVN